MPHGKHAAVDAPARQQPEPRAPFGPSVTRIGGMPSRSTPVMFHRSKPAVSDAFSSSESWLIRSSRSGTEVSLLRGA